MFVIRFCTQAAQAIVRPSCYNLYHDHLLSSAYAYLTMSGTRSQIEKAIIQIQDKQPVPEIDFTQHQLDNGFTISTQERVVKEVSVACIISKGLRGRIRRVCSSP